jgi:lipocalin
VTQLGGRDQVIARLYSGVWREINRIASDFEKGTELLCEWRVCMSVR